MGIFIETNLEDIRSVEIALIFAAHDNERPKEAHQAAGYLKDLLKRLHMRLDNY